MRDLLELRQSEAPGPGAAARDRASSTPPSCTRRAASSARRCCGSPASGRAFSGASDHLVSEALYLDDPDALGIELYRDRPRDAWPAPDPGERIKMDTLPLDLQRAGRRGRGRRRAACASATSTSRSPTSRRPRASGREEVGLELMTGWAGQAAFLAADGYHHHIGANAWYSRGADPEPPEGPGLDAVVLGGTGRAEELRTPDGLRVVLEP